MKILYDFQAFYQTKVGGVSRYFDEIIHNMTGVESRISAFSSINQHILGKGNFRYIEAPNNKLLKKALKTINEHYTLHDIKKENYDIFHPTGSDPYYINKVKKPVVATIHDMIWEIYHLNPVVESWRKKQCETADKIITVSEKTKEDLINIYNIDSSKIVRIYHGVSPVEYIKHDVPYGRYVLFVGKRKGYKNFSRFLKAMSILMEKDKELNVVCTGSPFDKKELAMIVDAKLSKRVFCVYVSDAELFNLYSNAEAFVYPSEYEGFGIPILEAFYCHCPVLLSSSSCFPEIGKDAVEYFTAEDIEEQAECIKRVIYDQKKRDDMIKKGNKRLKDFSWEESATEHYKLYQSLL